MALHSLDCFPRCLRGNKTWITVFSTIILLKDLARPLQADPEIATLPPGQRAEIQKHYRLVKHIPGPYLNGTYVYKVLTI